MQQIVHYFFSPVKKTYLRKQWVVLQQLLWVVSGEDQDHMIECLCLSNPTGAAYRKLSYKEKCFLASLLLASFLAYLH